MVDRVVELRLNVTLRMQLQVLTNAVKHHHFIVDRVTNDGQHGTDEGLVDLQRERQHALKQGEQADDEQGIEGQSHGRSHRERYVAEAH